VTSALRRFERRVRRRLGIRVGLRRVAESLPAIVQILAAAAAAYSITHWGFGHAAPLLAVTVTINSLGFARDARPRRVAETLLGIQLGILASDLISLLAGKGLWQVLVILLVVFVVGRAVSPNPAFAVAAAVPSAIVAILPTVDVAPFSRSLDGLVGGVVALAATALLPRDPLRAARNDGRAVFSVLGEAFEALVSAFRGGDEGAGELAVARLRRVDALLTAWHASLDTAVSVARISPFLRRRLPLLRRQARLRETAELVTGHLVPLARRTAYLVRDGEARPRLATVVARVARATAELGAELRDPDGAESQHTSLVELAMRLDPLRVVPGAGAADAAIVMQLRPLVVDLLVAAGIPMDEARRLLPDV
jgi:uncharacterized membrane protein YgaE (UPF0421/DUF939 family)